MLDYFALFLIFFVFLVIFYGIIAIHDIPYLIAEKRNHPQKDAIHHAGWVSLFTLHVIWPFLWIWATMKKPGSGWEEADKESSERQDGLQEQIQQLREEIAALKNQIDEKEQ